MLQETLDFSDGVEVGLFVQTGYFFDGGVFLRMVCRGLGSVVFDGVGEGWWEVGGGFAFERGWLFWGLLVLIFW